MYLHRIVERYRESEKEMRPTYERIRARGYARRVITAGLVLLDLNIALRQLTLGPLPVLRAVPLITLEATLPILVDQEVRYLKLVRRNNIIRFKNSIILVQYLKRSSHQSLRFGGGGSP